MGCFCESASGDPLDEDRRAQAVLSRCQLTEQIATHLEAENSERNPPPLRYAALKFMSHLLAHENNDNVTMLVDEFEIGERLIELLNAGAAGLPTSSSTSSATKASTADEGAGDEQIDAETEEANRAASVHLVRESLVALANLVCGPQAAIQSVLRSGLIPALINAWENAPQHGPMSVALQYNIIFVYVNLVKNPETTPDQIRQILAAAPEGGVLEHCLSIIPEVQVGGTISPPEGSMYWSTV